MKDFAWKMIQDMQIKSNAKGIKVVVSFLWLFIMIILGLVTYNNLLSQYYDMGIPKHG